MDNFPERFKLVRKSTGYSQDKFAEVLRVSSTWISKIETGKFEPSEQLIKSVCSHFNININWLLAGEGEMYAIPESHHQSIREPRKRYGTSQAQQDITDASDISPLIKKTIHILKSKTSYSSALASNINAFHEAVEAVNEAIESRELKEQVNILKSEVIQLKQYLVREKLDKTKE